MHPSIQRILLEFSNIYDPSIKRVTTIFLAYEFGHIMKEACEIFAHYNINCGCPPIEEILFIQEEKRRLQSPDYAAYNKNLRKKVPIPGLIDKISKQNDKFSIQRNELGFVLKSKLREYNERNIYNEEIVITYKELKGEPIPPILDYRSVPIKFLALLITSACHKGNLLLKEWSMR